MRDATFENILMRLLLSRIEEMIDFYIVVLTTWSLKQMSLPFNCSSLWTLSVNLLRRSVRVECETTMRITSMENMACVPSKITCWFE